MSDQQDPNWHANRLLALASRARETAEELRDTTTGFGVSSLAIPGFLFQTPAPPAPQAPIAPPPPIPVKWTSDKNPVTEENNRPRVYQGTKAPVQRKEPIPEEQVVEVIQLSEEEQAKVDVEEKRKLKEIEDNKLKVLSTPPVQGLSRYNPRVIPPVKPATPVLPVLSVLPATILVNGISFGDTAKEDTRVATVIKVNHIDQERDNQIAHPVSQYNLNYTLERDDSRDFKLTFEAKFDLPAEFDLNHLDKWGTIYDQGTLGSCVSNSVSASLRWILEREGKGSFNPSRLFIYYNGRQIEGYLPVEDSGISIRGGFQSVNLNSVCGEDNWQYIPDNFSIKPPQGCYDAAKTHNQFKYLSVNQNENDLKKCLTDGYPISFGLVLYESFMSTTVATTGKVTAPDTNKEQRCGGHCLTIIGYSDVSRMFTIVNSWSDKWGDKGYCYIPYDYITNSQLASDFWSPRSIN